MAIGRTNGQMISGGVRRDTSWQPQVRYWNGENATTPGQYYYPSFTFSLEKDKYYSFSFASNTWGGCDMDFLLLSNSSYDYEIINQILGNEIITNIYRVPILGAFIKSKVTGNVTIYCRVLNSSSNVRSSGATGIIS